MNEDDRFSALAVRFDQSPYARQLGMRVVELGPGYAKITMTVAPEHLNWEGYVHGGLLMSLADQAFGCATNTLDKVFVAVQFNIQFLAAPAPGDVLLAEGRVLHAGRRAGTAEMVVQDARGRLIAKATGTVVAVGERQWKAGS